MNRDNYHFPQKNPQKQPKNTLRWLLTMMVIVGLPDAAVKESRDRVMTAMLNSGFKFPFGRTKTNLASADIKQEAPSFDLPIAIGLLAANEQIETGGRDRLLGNRRSRQIWKWDKTLSIPFARRQFFRAGHAPGELQELGVEKRQATSCD